MASTLVRVSSVIALVLVAVIVAFSIRERRQDAPVRHQVAAVHPTIRPQQLQPTRLSPPLVGATYMGDNWPKNFINAFRREDVASDYAKLRADGFNAVVLLVSWGDFQPVFAPCCQYDERAFERLEYLIDRARDAGLDVVLRIGYGWTFHPDAGEVGVRIHRLLNDVDARQAFLAYVARVGEVARKHANVRLSFLAWEDFILHNIDGDGRKDFRQFIDSLPVGDPLRASAASTPDLPQRDGPRVALFNAYWDWLLMQKIFKPTAARIPNLTYEARIDSEPLPHTNADGKVEYEWIGHESTYHPPGADAIALYWAPFWGAQNQGEQLDAGQALGLFNSLLAKVRQHSGGLPMFIDQLNVIDNTLGFERNATLRSAALPAFMDGAYCAMRDTGVFGYAFWTTHDYAESPLYNPSFAYKLDGWNLATGDGSTPESHLQARPSGDFDLRLSPGDRLRQIIPVGRGRLPTTSHDEHLSARICLSDRSGERAVVDVSAGAAPVRLKLGGSTTGRVCSKIQTRSRNGLELDLEIHAVRGSTALTNVLLFDHVQQGGLHKFDGKDGVLLPSLRKLNSKFQENAANALCEARTGHR